MKVLGICGSTRARSSNLTLLTEALRLLPETTSSEVFPAIAQLPIFNADLDGEGAAPPPIVAVWREEIRDADVVVISSPEYAFGVPGGLKNALDWIVSSGEFMDKPVALITASPNHLGGLKAHEALTLTLGVMGAKLVEAGSMQVGLVSTKFDAEGRISDPELVASLRAGLAACLEAATTDPSPPS